MPRNPYEEARPTKAISQARPPPLQTHAHETMPRTYTTPHGKNLTYVRKLGQGQFGVADLVRDRRGNEFCLKQVSVRTSDEDAKANVLKEVHIMKMSVHSNIVTLHDSWFDRNRMYILMAYCTNGSIDDLIHEYAAKKMHFTEDKIVSFLTELSSALAHLHEVLNIMHRDLKPANVFMDRIGTLKIGDFGLSKCLGADNLCATFVGTPLYMSPEQCNGERYSYETDVWALGCIAFEFMALHSPWDGPQTTYPALIHRIRTKSPDFEVALQRYSQNLVNCTSSMLQRVPYLRWTASQVNANMRPSMVNAAFDTKATPKPLVGHRAPMPLAHCEDSPREQPPTAVPIASASTSLVDTKTHPPRGDATAAVLAIQHSFRTTLARRNHRLEQREPVVEDVVAVEKIQTMFRQSLTRRRRPVTPRARNISNHPSQVQCTARINQLAVPRTSKKTTPLPRITQWGVMPQRPPPRPAWM